MSNSTIYRRKYSYTITDALGNSSQGTSDSGTILDLQDTVDKGDTIAQFRKVIASGGNATTRLSGVKWKLLQVPSALSHGYRSKTSPLTDGSDVVLNGNLLPLQIASPSAPPSLGLTTTTANNQALTRYYSNLAGVSSQFKGEVFAGELRETLSMIRHPARALRNGMRDYLVFLRKNARNQAKHKRKKFVRDTWLEYSFGFKPLINDLDSAIKAFYQSKWTKPIFEMVKGTGRENISAINPAAIYFDVGGGHELIGKLKSEEEQFVKYFGIYFSTNTGVSDPHSYGFSPWEFVPTLWELIPYSFLVDYFSNVGNILNSWSYRFLANGWTAKTERRAWRQYTIDVEVRPQAGMSSGLYDFRTSGNPGFAAVEAVSFIRSPNATLDSPSLELKVPGNWTQWVNIFALTKNLGSARKALAQ